MAVEGEFSGWETFGNVVTDAFKGNDTNGGASGEGNGERYTALLNMGKDTINNIVNKGSDPQGNPGAVAAAYAAKKSGFQDKYAENLALAKQFMTYGSAIGGAIGACFGGVGAPVGAAIGAVVGAIAGFIVPFFKELGKSGPEGRFQFTKDLKAYIDATSNLSGKIWMRDDSIIFLDKACIDYGEPIVADTWYLARQLKTEAGIIVPFWVMPWTGAGFAEEGVVEAALYSGAAVGWDPPIIYPYLDICQSLVGISSPNIDGNMWNRQWNKEINTDTQGRRNLLRDNQDYIGQHPASASWLAFVANGVPDPQLAADFIDVYNEAIPLVKTAINSASNTQPVNVNDVINKNPPKKNPVKPTPKAPAKAPVKSTLPAKQYFLGIAKPQAYYFLIGVIAPIIILLAFYFYKKYETK